MGADREAGSEAEELEDRIAQPQLVVQLRRDARPGEPGRRGLGLRTGRDLSVGLYARIEVGLLQLELVQLELVQLEQLLMELVQLECDRGLEFVELELLELELVQLEFDVVGELA